MQTVRSINLLFINVSDDLVTDSLNIIKEGNFNPDYNCIYSKTGICQTSEKNINWDLIIVSETTVTDTFPILRYIKNHFENVPIIFLTQKKAKDMTVPAMQNGADDCVAVENMERLLPIVSRELNSKRLQNKFVNEEIDQDLISTAFNYCTDEIYIFSLEDFKCLYLNQDALNKNDYDRQNIHQLSPADIYIDYNPVEFKKLITPLLQGILDKISLCIRKKGKGTLNPSETLFRLIKWNGQNYLLTINKDISLLQGKTQELRKQQSISRKYAKSNEMKSEFLADAAHDIRTSLNSIILANMLVAKKIGKDAESDFKKLTRAINYSSNYLLNYLDEFFDLPSEQWGDFKAKMSIIDAQVYGQKLYYMFDPVAKKNGITFKYETSELINNKIKTNPTYLKRIVKNVLSNAFKYTPDGFVTIRLYNPNDEELKKVKFNSEYAVAFQVEDTGIGIPKEDQKKIFNRRSRSKHVLMGKFMGSGLGLDISKQLTAALGGLLHVESEEYQGSTFTLYLPGQKPNKNKPVESVSKHSSIYDLSGNDKGKLQKTILIVDDSPIHNLAIKELLSLSFEQCITTTSKVKAYEYLEKEDIDCIILDYAINKENCIDMAGKIKIKPEYDTTPIIIYTGKKLLPNEKQILNNYAQAIVKKKVGSHNVLIKTIHRLLMTKNQI